MTSSTQEEKEEEEESKRQLLHIVKVSSTCVRNAHYTTHSLPRPCPRPSLPLHLLIFNLSLIKIFCFHFLSCCTPAQRLLFRSRFFSFFSSAFHFSLSQFSCLRKNSICFPPPPIFFSSERACVSVLLCHMPVRFSFQSIQFYVSCVLVRVACPSRGFLHCFSSLLPLCRRLRWRRLPAQRTFLIENTILNTFSTNFYYILYTVSIEKCESFVFISTTI